jgi:hypothetical protein
MVLSSVTKSVTNPSWVRHCTVGAVTPIKIALFGEIGPTIAEPIIHEAYVINYTSWICVNKEGAIFTI